jgi:hypothetical protein
MYVYTCIIVDIIVQCIIVWRERERVNDCLRLKAALSI